MKGTSVHIKNIMELNSSVIIRFEILLWLSGCENFPGPSRNGPQAGTLRCVLGQDTLLSLCLSPPRCINGTGEFTAGGNPAMD